MMVEDALGLCGGQKNADGAAAAAALSGFDSDTFVTRPRSDMEGAACCVPKTSDRDEVDTAAARGVVAVAVDVEGGF